MSAATGQTGNRATNPADAWKIAPALWTTIEKTAPAFDCREWQIVTAFFVADPKIAARLTPLGAVRRNPATTSAKLCENMRQLMSQRAIDFTGMLRDLRIQRDQFRSIIRPARASSQSRVPFHADFIGDCRSTIRA
jgi:hypothetical protein